MPEIAGLNPAAAEMHSHSLTLLATKSSDIIPKVFLEMLLIEL